MTPDNRFKIDRFHPNTVAHAKSFETRLCLSRYSTVGPQAYTKLTKTISALASPQFLPHPPPPPGPRPTPAAPPRGSYCHTRCHPDGSPRRPRRRPRSLPEAYAAALRLLPRRRRPMGPPEDGDYIARGLQTPTTPTSRASAPPVRFTSPLSLPTSLYSQKKNPPSSPDLLSITLPSLDLLSISLPGGDLCSWLHKTGDMHGQFDFLPISF
jgi:hypothetical protein